MKKGEGVYIIDENPLTTFTKRQSIQFLESNYFGILPKTPTADVETIFTDQTMVISADTAVA